MQGYVFIVYTTGAAATPHSEFRIYKSTAATTLNMLVNNSVNTLVPSAGQPVWYRASANGSGSTDLIFEYSRDSLSWTTAATYTVATTTYPSGATQIVWGLAAGNWDFYMDNITYSYYQTNPLLSLSTTGLSGFGYMKGTGPSSYQSFKIAGSFLTDNIEISSPDNYEISLDPESGYLSSLVLTGSGTQEVYVRLKSGLDVNSYNEDITVTSTGAGSKTVSLTGAVTLNTGTGTLTSPQATVVSKEYYTVTGQRVYNLVNQYGVFIVRALMSDGTVTTTKVLIMDK
jgi:hypothetical protein